MKCTTVDCPKEASHWLRCNGDKVPGSWVCEDCARRILAEYTTKLLPEEGVWDAIPIDELGEPVEGRILTGKEEASTT